MANPTVVTLTKDVWTKVLSGVTRFGKITVLGQEQEPTAYIATFVQENGTPPANDYSGGVPFSCSASPSNSSSIDIYVMPKTFDGKVVVFQ